LLSRVVFIFMFEIGEKITLDFTIDIYATKIRTVYLSDTRVYLHQSSLALCFRVYVFGWGVRFGNVCCIIIDLYSDASELW